MVYYPQRKWYHPLRFLASNPGGYVVGIYWGTLCLIYPWRHKIARYHERQRDTTASAPRTLAVRYYKHLEMMLKREALYKQPMIMDEQPFARLAQSVLATSHQFGIVDTELDYWNSHQKDLMRAAKLTDELREIKARIAAGSQ
jgi:hypothetical protein